MNARWTDIVGAASFLVSAAAFLFGVYTYHRSLRRQNRQATLDYAEEIRERTQELDAEISEVLHLDTKEERLNRSEARRLLSDEAGNRELLGKISLLLSKLEHLALSAEIGLFDVPSINELMGRKFIRFHNFFVDYIDEVRRLPGESATTYEHLTSLASELHRLRIAAGIPSELARPSPSLLDAGR